MSRLLLLLMLIVFGTAQVMAAPMALCRHGDSEAHAAALQSSDSSVAGEAHQEEAAKAVAEKQGSLADAASAAFGQVLLPASLTPPNPRLGRGIVARAVPASPLSGRIIAPLLDPPLA